MMAADVLTFDASRRRLQRPGANAIAGEVLVFSGVRYDRSRADATEHSKSAADLAAVITPGQDGESGSTSPVKSDA
jgi:hypothetical protein